MAIRDMDTAAAVIGIPVARYKHLAFAVSSFYLALPARCGPSPTWARPVPAASISTGRSRSCSSSSSAAWAALPATSSARRSSACCRSCSATPGKLLLGGAVDAGQLQNLQKIIFGVLIILFLIKEPEGLIRLLATFANG
jgi:branched-chain amino acid transport system permease protein